MQKNNKVDLTIRYLRSLPSFLTVRDLSSRDFNHPKDTMDEFCRLGLVDEVGDNCYHNVLAGRMDIYNAIKSLISLPIYGHISCLHDYGVITQIPQQDHIYVIDQPNAPILNEVCYIHKSMDWLNGMLEVNAILQVKGVEKHRSRHPIATLHPQFVYQDMVNTNDMCGLDPDDFDWYFMDIDGDIEFVLPVPEAESTFDNIGR